MRPEGSGDAEAIRGVHTASFPTPAEARLIDLLRNARHLTVSLVAELGGRVIGHVAFSPVTVATGAGGVGLAPVAVVEEYRRRGIAACLIDAGLTTCRDAQFGWVVVLGDPACCSRFGFRPAAEFGLRDEYGGGSAFQAMELIPSRMPIAAGLVRYAQAFASLGSQ